MGHNRGKTQERAEGGIGQRFLLVLAQASSDTDDLLEPLLKRPDLCLFRVATLAAAEVALRGMAVSLAIVCPETSGDQVTALLESVEVLRPGTPVLAIRARGDEPAPTWKAGRVGVLRSPVVPEVLSRTVDVALGLWGSADVTESAPKAKTPARHGPRESGNDK
jgi:hypothetical protein